MPCPMCGGGEDFHLGINLRSLYGSCWRCGKHALFDVVKALDAGIKWDDLKAIKDGLEVVPNTFDNKRRGRYKPPDGLGELTERHAAYLQSRRIDTRADWFAAYGLRSISILGGAYKYRIFLPVTLGRKDVSYTTRSTSSTGQRYLSAAPADESVRHKELLFAEDFVRDAIIVHEGPLDALRVGPGATATFGTAFTKQQLHRVGRYPKRYVCFDAEPLAQRRAEKLADDLSVLPGKTWNVCLDAGDAGSATARDVARLRKLVGR